jgi:hypothetical protein
MKYQKIAISKENATLAILRSLYYTWSAFLDSENSEVFVRFFWKTLNPTHFGPGKDNLKYVDMIDIFRICFRI